MAPKKKVVCAQLMGQNPTLSEGNVRDITFLYHIDVLFDVASDAYISRQIMNLSH